MSKFAERLKELREEMGLTQKDLAKLMEVSSACINRWENGLRVPNADSIVVASKVLNVPSDYLLGLID